jgi:hypothetical protein
MPWKLPGMGLLALMLTGCGSLRPPEVRVLTPPGALLEDCTYTETPLSTNADLARAYLGLRNALDLCNNDKEALREWVQRVQTQK